MRREPEPAEGGRGRVEDGLERAVCDVEEREQRVAGGGEKCARGEE